MRVVRRPVERIDDPLIIARRPFTRHIARLFRKDRMAWVIAADALNDETLRRKVSLRDEINVALMLHAQRRAPEAFRENAPGIAGGLNSEIEHGKAEGRKQKAVGRKQKAVLFLLPSAFCLLPTVLSVSPSPQSGSAGP